MLAGILMYNGLTSGIFRLVWLNVRLLLQQLSNQMYKCLTNIMVFYNFCPIILYSNNLLCNPMSIWLCMHIYTASYTYNGGTMTVGVFPLNFCLSKMRYADVTGPYFHYMNKNGNIIYAHATCNIQIGKH